MPQAAQRPRIEGREISTRSYSRAPQSVDVATRTFGMIVSTETPVRTHILDPRTYVYVEADEVLKADGLDLSRAAGMPLVDTHNTWGSITNILGRVFNVRVEEGVVVADAQLNSRNADLIADIAEDPHFAARGNLLRMVDELAGEVVIPNVLPRLSETPGRVTHLGPALGADNDAIYGDLLGLGTEERAALKNAKVI